MTIRFLCVLLFLSLIGCGSSQPNIIPTTNGNNRGVLELMSAARQGGASSQYLIGKYYVNGTNLPLDADRGAQWLKRGAKTNFPHAKYELALLHIEGRGVPKDPVEANRLLASASQQGYIPAQRFYSLFLYRAGPEELRDPVRAYGWLSALRKNSAEEYQGVAFLTRQIEGELSESDLEQARVLSATYPGLYPPWNQR